MLVFSTSDVASMDALPQWKTKARSLSWWSLHSAHAHVNIPQQYMGCLACIKRHPPQFVQVEEECGAIAMALVQNKCDLLGNGGVSADAAEAMARRLRLRVYRTCVREGLNCDAGGAHSLP